MPPEIYTEQEISIISDFHHRSGEARPK
jgi:hypothetical protein